MGPVYMCTCILTYRTYTKYESFSTNHLWREREGGREGGREQGRERDALYIYINVHVSAKLSSKLSL